ncbi:MAG TPA: tyrosine-type recombinase/integrase [Pseudonocardiaceae bacterium]|jgi:integrase/recombinase XerD
MTELLPARPVPSPDDERWQEGLHLIGQWLAEYSGNSRTTYADAIGWPYRVTTGEWRGYRAVRQGFGWLAWCHRNGVHLFDAKRLHVLAWIDAAEASRDAETDEPLSKRSRAQMVATASSFYVWAMHDGHTESNPVALIDRRKKGLQASNDPSTTRSLSKAEVRALIHAADNDPVEGVHARSSALIALLFLVGPRVSEVCGAMVGDMYVQDGRRVLRSELKGHKEHIFALPPQVCSRIDAYLASRSDLNRLPVRRGHASAAITPLFATATGKPMLRREVLALVKRIAALAGVDDPDSVHPHVGRHSFITEARRQGYAAESIQHAVGHQYGTTTARYGVHIINLERSPAYGVAAAFDPDTTDG